MEPAANDSESALVTVHPGRPAAGSLAVPGSKSLAQRQLLGAFLASGVSQVDGLPENQDVASLLGALRTLAGAKWGSEGSYPGRPTDGQTSAQVQRILSVGESGTAARLLSGCLALSGAAESPFRIVPQGTLVHRSSAPLVRALRDAGARPVTPKGVTGSWPLSCQPVDCPEQLILRDPQSSQELSALLFALARRGTGVLTVHGAIPSLPYVRLTQAVLATFGVQVVQTGKIFEVRGELVAPVGVVRVEPDASAAAVALAAGCVSGGTVCVPGLDSSSDQGDVRVMEHLRAFGCRAVSEPSGLIAGGHPRRGASLDLQGEPDLAPVLAVVAALACLHSGEPSRLSGLGTLDGKESPRLSGLVESLTRLGWGVRRGPDWLSVESPPSGGADPRRVTDLDPRGDHRMAFAFGLLGMGFEGLRIRDSGCVAKSWPGFWNDLSHLGARVEN